MRASGDQSEEPGDSVENDTVATETIETVEETGQPSIGVERPSPQVSFGRRDVRTNGYPAARRVAVERGFEPVERDVGGRAVAHTGHTLAFAVAVPVADTQGIADRYRTATAAIHGALDRLGADVARGEPPQAYCAGSHSLRVPGGGKCCGLAQRVTRDVGVVAGYLVVRTADEPAIAGVLSPVYEELDVPFDPATVGSLERAGGPSDPAIVADRLAGALGDRFG